MIDTAEKRRAAAAVPFWVYGPGVTPNAVHDPAWRQEAGWGYSGISVIPPTPARAGEIEIRLGETHAAGGTDRFDGSGGFGFGG